MDDLLNILKYSDPEIYLAQTLSGSKKSSSEILFVLFCLNYELSRIIPISTNNETAMLRYKWWSDTVGKILNNKKSNYDHYLLKSLSRIISKYNIKEQDIDIIFSTRGFDLTGTRFKDFRELEQYIDGSLGQIFIIYQEYNDISLSQAEASIMKEISYIIKTLRILLGLKRHQYNNHPFVTQEIISNLTEVPAMQRQEQAYNIIRKYLLEKYDIVSKTKIKNDILLENIRKIFVLQVRSCLKHKKLDDFRFSHNSQLLLKYYFFKIAGFRW